MKPPIDADLRGWIRGKSACIGGAGWSAAQLRLKAFIAELLIRAIARLEYAVGTSQQYVAGAQLQAPSGKGSRREDAEQRSTFGKRFQLPVRAQQQRGRMSGTAVVERSSSGIEPRQE